MSSSSSLRAGSLIQHHPPKHRPNLPKLGIAYEHATLSGWLCVLWDDGGRGIAETSAWEQGVLDGRFSVIVY